MLYGKKEVHDPINGIKKGYFPQDPLKWAHDTFNGIMNGYLALFLERSVLKKKSHFLHLGRFM